MLSAVNTLFNEIFAVIFPAWLSTEVVQYLIGVIIFTVIVSLVLRFFHRGF